MINFKIGDKVVSETSSFDGWGYITDVDEEWATVQYFKGLEMIHTKGHVVMLSELQLVGS